MALHCGAHPTPPSRQFLAELATTLASTARGPASVLGVVPGTGGGHDLVVAPCGAGGPFTELLGWRAPAGWWAVGLVAPATATPTGARSERPGARWEGPGARSAGGATGATGARAVIADGCPAGADPVLVLLVDRGGDVSCSLGDASGPAWQPGDLEGRLLDACRRSLDLGTPPPARPVGELWSQRWLDALLDRLARGERPDSTSAAGLHPLAGLLGPRAPDLPALGRTSVARTTWSELRAVASGAPGLADIEPALAAWMDDGMFARWLMDLLPPVDELLLAVRELAPPALWRSVSGVVSIWRETP